MKNIQNILVVLALGAVTAKADYTLTAGAAQNVALGDVTTHISYYNLDVTVADEIKLAAGVNGLNLYAVDKSGGITSSASYDPSGLALTSTLTSVPVGDYTLAVSWVLSTSVGEGSYTGATGPYGITLDLFGNDAGTGITQGQQAWDTVNVVAVPEPAQAIASVALLGCGGLVFIGRRFIGKKA